MSTLSVLLGLEEMAIVEDNIGLHLEVILGGDGGIRREHLLRLSLLLLLDNEGTRSSGKVRVLGLLLVDHLFKLLWLKLLTLWIIGVEKVRDDRVEDVHVDADILIPLISLSKLGQL